MQLSTIVSTFGMVDVKLFQLVLDHIGKDESISLFARLCVTAFGGIFDDYRFRCSDVRGVSRSM